MIVPRALRYLPPDCSRSRVVSVSVVVDILSVFLKLGEDFRWFYCYIRWAFETGTVLVQ